MASRLQLQTELETILGTRNVYFQPPEGFKLQYPCIIYQLDAIRDNRANDKIYTKKKQYAITIIDRDPDSIIPDTILESFNYCSFDRFFTSDQLNHFVLTLFY